MRIAIDEALEQKPHDFDAFLALLAEQGFKVKKGRHLTFTHADFKQNIRSIAEAAIFEYAFKLGMQIAIEALN